jgi:PAS domain S-box-containing protein
VGDGDSNEPAASYGAEPDEARTLLAAVVDSTDDAIITKGLDGTITSWNAAAVRLLGYHEREALGQSVLMLIPTARRAEEAHIIENIRAGKRVEHYETVRVCKDGRPIDVALTISPIRNPHGEIVGASKIMRDITERKRTERALTELLEERNRLLESERAARSQAEHLSAVKDQFLALLSHELRTPLNAILGWTQILQRSGPTPADLGKGLEVIERNVRAQSQLVEDLLDTSRIVSGQMRLDVQPLMPYAFVHGAVEAMRPAADARGIRLVSLVDPTAGLVSGDPQRLQQVIWNLVSNAIKFTPNGGQVDVVVRQMDSSIEISVADTGIGIDKDFLPHVFERFRQADASSARQYNGLGLGLSLVRHLVELHGGSVGASSDGPRKGATFYVRLPCADMRPSPFGPSTRHPLPHITTLPLAQADLSNVRIVVIDDEPDARELVSRLLSNTGATVVTAGSGLEGLAAIDRQNPDVIVSDIGMPGMDGYELMRHVRAKQQELGVKCPAVALTAFARSEDRTRALLAGFAAHVAKPVEAPELIATIASVIGRTI